MRTANSLLFAFLCVFLAGLSACDLFTPKEINDREATFALVRSLGGAFRVGDFSSGTRTTSSGGRAGVIVRDKYDIDEYTFLSGSVDFEDLRLQPEQIGFYDDIDNIEYSVSGHLEIECDFRVKDFGHGAYPFYCFTVDSGSVEISDSEGARREVSAEGMYFSLELQSEGDGSYSASIFSMFRLDESASFEQVYDSYCYWIDEAGWRME
jgi:hypothetical protein